MKSFWKLIGIANSKRTNENTSKDSKKLWKLMITSINKVKVLVFMTTLNWVKKRNLNRSQINLSATVAIFMIIMNNANNFQDYHKSLSYSWIDSNWKTEIMITKILKTKKSSMNQKMKLKLTFQ